MATPIDIKAALEKLDTSNANHWTSEGLPRLETVKMLVGDQSVTREQVTQAYPGFTRASATVPAAVQPTASVPTPPTVPTTEVVTTAASAAAQAPVDDEELDKEIERAYAELQSAKQDYHRMSVYRARFEVDFAAQAAKVDKLNAAYEKLVPVETITDVVQSYHESRRAQMAAAAQKVVNWKELGVRIQDLVPQRAPIDAALARNTRRGAKRPGSK